MVSYGINDFFIIGLYPEASGEKQHINPPKTNLPITQRKFQWTDFRWLKPPAKGLISDKQISLKKRKKFEEST